MKPLLYLELRQLINSIKNTARTPKRLIPALIVGAWVVSWFVRGFMLCLGEGPRVPNMSFLGDVDWKMIRQGVFLFMSVSSVLVIYGAFSSGMMIFSVSQIDFLFPTPISRRTVLLVKLAKDYLKYGAYVAFFYLFIGFPVFGILRVSFMPAGLCSIAAVTALLVLVVNVSHTINIMFTFGFERLKQAGLAIKAALIAVPASAFAIGAYQFARTGDSYASVLSAANSPIIKWVFAPADWCATLFLIPLNSHGVTSDDVARLFLLIGLAIMSFLVLLSRKENIYEPSLGVSVKFAARRSAMRAGDYVGVRTDVLREKGTTRAGWLAIPPFGQGAMALLWKSLLLRYRISVTQLLMMLALPAFLVYVIKSVIPTDEPLHYLPFLLVYVVWILSLIAASEMRSELKQANIIKSMPIAAWKVMLVQAVNSTVYLTLGACLFALSIRVLAPEVDRDLLGACILIAPSLGFMNVSLAIVTAILYPDLRDPAQSFLGGLVAFMLISAAFVPCVLTGWAMARIAGMSLPAAALAASAVNLAIGSAAIAVAGILFRRFDPTSE